MKPSEGPGEPGSKINREFEADESLANSYLQDANAKDLYALYQKRCKQLISFGDTLASMAELYAGKSDRPLSVQHMPDAVAAMERVAIAAIELAKAVAERAK